MQKELILFRAALCGFAALVLTACGGQQDQKKVAPIPVKAEVIASHPDGGTVRYVGSIEAISETPLSMQAGGRVSSIHCVEGERVHKGKVLLCVDSTRAVNALRAAEAGYRQAQDGYERVKQVHAKGAVTDQKLVEVESQRNQARALYESARRQVNECKLVAPNDGVVSGLNLQTGQTIIPGSPVLTLMDVSAFCIRFTVPETEIGGVRIGQNGVMECAAVDQSYAIRVTEKGMKANPVAHTYEVKATIEGDTKDLLSGMVGKVIIGRNDGQDGGMVVVPAQCVLLKPEGPTIWTAAEGRARRRMITIDGYSVNGVCVREGLHAGDTIITEGYQKLYDGCTIVIQ